MPQWIAAGVDPSPPIGLFLLAWLIFTTYMTVASFRVSVVTFAVFVFLWPALLLLTIGALAHSENCTRAGGWFGLICSLWAFYGSAAVVINTTYGRTVLPVGTHVQPEVMQQATAAAAAHWKAAAGSAASAPSAGGGASAGSEADAVDAARAAV